MKKQTLEDLIGGLNPSPNKYETYKVLWDAKNYYIIQAIRKHIKTTILPPLTITYFSPTSMCKECRRGMLRRMR